MTLELTAEQVGISLTVLGTVVGYLARTKADVIILKRDLASAWREIDKLKQLPQGNRAYEACTRADIPEEKETP